jgi:CBS-domain-containing membrane protein
MVQSSWHSARNQRANGVSRLGPELIEALPRIAHRTPVARAMERASFLVGPTMTLVDLMRLFVDMGAHAAPVVDEQGEPIGVVSKADAFAELSERPESMRRSGVYRAVSAASKSAVSNWDAGTPALVRDIMTPLTTVVFEETTLADAAALIANRRIHPLPVMDEQGQVAGILSSIDVLRWLARNDGHQYP